MTLSLLNNLGIKTSFRKNIIKVENLDKIEEKNIMVESDWSSASYWYSVVALCEKAEIKLNNLYKNSIQGDSILIKIFRALGVKTKFEDNKIILSKTRDFLLPKKLSIKFNK